MKSRIPAKRFASPISGSIGDDHYIHHPILYIDKKFSDINTVRGIVCHQREAPGAKHLGTNLLTLLSIELRCMRSFLLCFFDKKTTIHRRCL